MALVEQLKKQGAQSLLAPTAALHHSDRVLPAVDAQVILLWCEARVLPGWCFVPEGRPGAELLPLVRREELLPP